MPRNANFDPLTLLDAHPRPSFDARTVYEAQAWQKRTRRALGECLGFLDEPKVDPKPRVIEKRDRGSFVREKLVIRTTRHSELPFYLLIPKKRDKPAPLVLALHGHGYGVKDIVGLWEDGSERDEPDGYHNDFACGLASRGFIVAAPEISCFGERQHDYKNAHLWRLSPTCHGASTYAMMLG